MARTEVDTGSIPTLLTGERVVGVELLDNDLCFSLVVHTESGYTLYVDSPTLYRDEVLV